MGKYVKAFVKDESGMETIEFVVILAIVAGLIAVISAVGSTVRIKQTKRRKDKRRADAITYE